MTRSDLTKFLALLGAFITAAQAQTSLFVPGFDPQPLSADILGIDEKGRTTWALHAGQATGDQDVGLPPSVTVTLVEGPSNAGYTMTLLADSGATITAAYDCSLSANLAVCSANAGGETGVMTVTQDPFIVQGGTTAAVVGISAPTSVASSSRPNTGEASQTSSGTAATQSNGSKESKASVKVLGFVSGLAGLAGIVMALQ